MLNWSGANRLFILALGALLATGLPATAAMRCERLLGQHHGIQLPLAAALRASDCTSAAESAASAAIIGSAVCGGGLGAVEEPAFPSRSLSQCRDRQLKIVIVNLFRLRCGGLRLLLHRAALGLPAAGPGPRRAPRCGSLPTNCAQKWPKLAAFIDDSETEVLSSPRGPC
jgi:hypothetical protein